MSEVVSGVSDVGMATSLLLSRNLAGMGLEQEVPPPPRLGDMTKLVLLFVIVMFRLGLGRRMLL